MGSRSLRPADSLASLAEALSGNLVLQITPCTSLKLCGRTTQLPLSDSNRQVICFTRHTLEIDTPAVINNLRLKWAMLDGFLPCSVLVLWFKRRYVCRNDHLLDPGSEIPTFDYFVAILLILNENIYEACSGKHRFQFLHGNCPGNSTAVGIFILFYVLRKLALLENIRDRKPASGPQYSKGFN